MTSHDPDDVSQRYCGNCHQYHDTMARLGLDSLTVHRMTDDPAMIRLTALRAAADVLSGVAAAYVQGHVQGRPDPMNMADYCNVVEVATATLELAENFRAYIENGLPE